MAPRSLSGLAVAVIAVAMTGTANAQQSEHAQHHSAQGQNAMLKTPGSIAAEHKVLHSVLQRATRETGEVGKAARELEAVLSPHFRREEEIATPPLGLLPALASGPVTSEMAAVLPMTEALERELPQMLDEHQSIRTALRKFRAAAQAAGRTEYVAFSDELAAHAREEEEIHYPAAILVGRYVAQALNR